MKIFIFVSLVAQLSNWLVAADGSTSAKGSTDTSAKMRRRAELFYSAYNPTKLDEAGFMDKVMRVYAGKEEKLFARLVKQYGPEPVKVTQYAGPTKCKKSTKEGDRLTIHYTGKIDESSKTGVKGKQFDSSRGREAFEFILGNGEVIKGWDHGLVDLCYGAKATLVIQPEFGYGDGGAGADIPGGATLNFDVELTEFASPPNTFKEIDGHGFALNGEVDGVLTEEEVKAYFKGLGRSYPYEMFAREDKNKDGVLSWEEFGGPKGKYPPKVTYEKKEL